MIVFGLYLRKGIVYLPTMAKVPSGGYQEIDPVSVVPASGTEALGKALEENIMRGNPILENYSPSNYSQAVVLKYAGVKNFSTFARGAQPWNIIIEDGVYEIQGQRRRPDRGWEEDPNNRIIFPAGTTEDDVIKKMVQILQKAAASDSSP